MENISFLHACVIIYIHIEGKWWLVSRSGKRPGVHSSPCPPTHALFIIFYPIYLIIWCLYLGKTKTNKCSYSIGSFNHCITPGAKTYQLFLASFFERKHIAQSMGLYSVFCWELPYSLGKKSSDSVLSVYPSSPPMSTAFWWDQGLDTL